MKRLLHIIATPRVKESRTLQVSDVFLEGIMKRCPDCLIDTLNVFTEKLPPITVKGIGEKLILLGGGEIPEGSKDEWNDTLQHVERFLSADMYLVSSPMWNFNIAYPLKHYIDIIVQPKYLFRYTEKGPEGLVKGKKMVVITSRGGDYSQESPFHAYDLQEPYLRTVFGFVGITDITFINAQPMDALGVEAEKERLERAKTLARGLVDNLACTAA